MKTTQSEYEKRKNEVCKYIDAVKCLDKGDCKIICTDILGEESSMHIDDELSKILKANSFILLYNLIESTVVNSIKAVSNSIHNDNLTYEQLSDKIKHLWIKQESKKLKGPSQAADIIQKITESVVNKQLLSLQPESVNISGNIDAQKIREIANQIGWEVSKDGRELATIKNKRNSLAHGEYTFSAIGKDFTINDLEKYRNKTLGYLDDVLSKVETFITQQKYKTK